MNSNDPSPVFSVKSTSKKHKPTPKVKHNTAARGDIRISDVIPTDLFDRSPNKDFD